MDMELLVSSYAGWGELSLLLLVVAGWLAVLAAVFWKVD